MKNVLTKSKYVTFCLCPRKAWRELFDPLAPTGGTSRADDGVKVGILARDYFGKNLWTPADRNNPSTKPGIYAEYPLRFNNLECFVDILRINDDGSIDIYEVKSVNEYETSENSNTPKKKFLEDVSFQYYVALKAGFNVKSVNLMLLNKEYIYMGGEYDLHGLFKVIVLTDMVTARTNEVEQNINDYFALDRNIIPNCPFSSACNEYGGCQYLEDCKAFKGLPKTQSVYDLYDYGNKVDLIEMGYKSFKDLIKSPYFEKLSAFNQRMVTYSLLGINDLYVNKELLEKELKKYNKFPLYFFDFETTQEVLPVYINSRPYQQIPFQYSLHIMNDEHQSYSQVCNIHEEYLGDGINDPREELIKKMIKDLGKKGKIIAYNKSFEQNIIKQLAIDFPQYRKKLEDIHKRFIDLADFFDFSDPIGWKSKTENAKRVNRNTSIVYHPAMGASTSIKQVLPALFPNNPTLNYKNLGQVQHGDQASASYKLLKTLNQTQKDQLIKDMLAYCCLDTKAMVAVYFKLKELL